MMLRARLACIASSSACCGTAAAGEMVTGRSLVEPQFLQPNSVVWTLQSVHS